MSNTPEVPKVRISRDNGEKNVWGAGRWVYRRDGRKSTLESKKIAIGIAIVFLISSLIVLVSGGSSSIENLRTLNAPSTGAGNQMIQVPAFVGELARNFARGRFANDRPKFLGPKVIARPRSAKIPPGSIVRATLETGASNGPIKARLIEPLVLNGETLLEEGTALIGIGNSNEDRLMVMFSKVVFTDGSTQTVQAQACDLEDKIAGLRGEVVNREVAKLGAGVGLNFAGGLAEGLEETEVQNGVAVRKSDMRNALLNGSAHAAIDQGKEVMSNWRAKKAVVNVKEGTPFYVLFEG